MTGCASLTIFNVLEPEKPVPLCRITLWKSAHDHKIARAETKIYEKHDTTKECRLRRSKLLNPEMLINTPVHEAPTTPNNIAEAFNRSGSEVRAA